MPFVHAGCNVAMTSVFLTHLVGSWQLLGLQLLQLLKDSSSSDGTHSWCKAQAA
jgi:hypothetical protein